MDTPDADVAVTLLSHSRMSVYASCPEKFRLLYVEETPPAPQGGFLGGIAIHDTIEWVEKELDPTHETLFADDNAMAPRYFIELLERRVEEAGGYDAVRWSRQGGEDLVWWKRYGPGMLRSYHKLRMHDVATDRWVIPEFTEAEMTLEVSDHNALVRGRTDAVLRELPDGSVTVRDYKTNRLEKAAALQLALYARMLEPHLGEMPKTGELVSLRRYPNTLTFPIEPYLDVAYRWLEGVVVAIKEGRYFMSPSSFCVSCSVRAACEWGKTLEGSS